MLESVGQRAHYQGASMAAIAVHERRMQLQACRTCVRKAVTAVQTSRSLWEEAVNEGKSALGSLCNTHLRLAHLPALNLKNLKQVPGISTAAGLKLFNMKQEEQLKLCQAVTALEGAASTMAEASLSVQQQAAAASASLQTAHVFTCLSIDTISQMIDQLVATYAAQLQVRTLHGGS